MSVVPSKVADDVACAVITSNLTRRFGRVTAVDAVDLRIPTGAVSLLVGANGSGKSTLLRMLLGLERPDAGTAVVCGLDVGRRGPAARAQIGFIPEVRERAQAWLTCTQLFEFLACYYPQWDADYAEYLTQTLGLRADVKIGALSKGERRRLEWVQALAHEPPVLLLDEPTEALDAVIRRRVVALLAEHLAERPATVLMATHDVAAAESLADHVCVLRAGRLVTQMSRDELRGRVREYRIEVPPDWRPSASLHLATARRSHAGRLLRCTIIGSEADVTAQVEASGAVVVQSLALGLDDAALSLLMASDAA